MAKLKNFFNQINRAGRLYEGAGNRLLVVELTDYSRTDADLRSALTKVGLAKNADSILVLKRYFNRRYQVSMDVFEPRGIDANNPHLNGSWSTMCGNGVRAVARYLLEQGRINCYIKTRSGVRPVTLLLQSNFRVCMGEFTQRQKDLSSYVADFSWQKLLPRNLKVGAIFTGLNGTRNIRGLIDGEPHLVIFARKRLSLLKIKLLAEKIGPQITANRRYFPQEINTNIVSENSLGGLNACTFERGVEYVTQSCGTGATVIGSWWLNHYRDVNEIKINMPGGQLIISKQDNNFYLTGPANPVLSNN